MCQLTFPPGWPVSTVVVWSHLEVMARSPKPAYPVEAPWVRIPRLPLRTTLLDASGAASSVPDAARGVSGPGPDRPSLVARRRVRTPAGCAIGVCDGNAPGRTLLPPSDTASASRKDLSTRGDELLMLGMSQSRAG